MKEKPELRNERKEIVLVLLILVISVAIFNTIFFLAEYKPSIIGFVTRTMTLTIENSPPIINISDTSAYEGDLINFSECGYDPNGDDFNCTFSPPLNSSGQWQTSYGDAGVYYIEINATDSHNSTSTKTITLTIIAMSDCLFSATRSPLDGKTIELAWDFPPYNFENYTLYWTDTYIEDGYLNLGSAHNMTIYLNKSYNDSSASLVRQRYYRILGYNETDSYECNITTGKFDWNLVMNNGKWNYVSTPFYLENNQVEDVFKPIIDTGNPSNSKVDFIFWYNSSTGGFRTYNFKIGLGDLHYIYPGEGYIVQPKSSNQNLTLAGTIFNKLERNITTLNGRWNYIGWVAENTPRSEGENSIRNDFDFMFWYNSTTGGFRTFNNLIGLGDLNELWAGEVYWVQPTLEKTWYYDMYNTT